MVESSQEYIMVITFVTNESVQKDGKKQMLMKRNGAIVTAPSVTIKKTPVANSADQGVIHEGTRVDIIDDTMRDWKEIHLADGREGWIPATQIEKI